MAEGYRVTEDGSLRVTESLDLRITEQFAPLLATSSFLAEGTQLSIAGLVLVVSSGLVGSLSQLSASTYTTGGASVMTATGSVSANAEVVSNFIAELTATGSITPNLGYNHEVSQALTSAGTISSSVSLIKDASVSLSGSMTTNVIGKIAYEIQKTFSATTSVDAYTVLNYSPSLSLTGVGSVSPGATFTLGANSSLQSSSTFTIYPLLIRAAATLQGGTGTVTAYGGFLANAFASLSSNGSLIGNEDMIYNVSVVGTAPKRLTETGDIRITSTGDFRITNNSSNLMDSDLTASADVTQFNGAIYGHRQGSYKFAVPYVKYNGNWVVPTVYVKNQGIWKRVY